jgi:hypothetical protein
MAFMAMSAVIYLVMLTYFKRRNAAKVAGKEDYKVQGLTEEEAEELGEENPRFMYTY